MKPPEPPADECKLMERLSPDPSLGRLLGFLATTYEMQPEFFELDFLPTLLGLGAWDDRSWTSRIALEKHLAELEAAALLLDARAYGGRPRSLRVEVVPLPLENGRKLHAKVILGVYEESIRLIVGSANLTEPGYRRNREIVAVLTASLRRSAEARLIADAIRGMGSLIQQWTTTSARQLLTQALDWLDERAIGEASDQQWFAWGGGERALWRQFLDRWTTSDQVERISIVSPFWSEEYSKGPITTFVTAIKESGCLRKDTELFLLTEAAPDKQTTYKPRLPESFANFDACTIGVDAKALAVDPRVPPEEVGMGKDFSVTRNLHAKVVLLEGANTSLMFIGSANFTRHGWGFLPDPSQANIEAGLIVRLSGVKRSVFQDLIPKTTGDAVPLTGAASSRLALPDPSPEKLPWPTFLGEVLLVPSKEGAEQLELVVTVTKTAEGPWLVALLPRDDSPKQVLLEVKNPEPSILRYSVSLNDDSRARLLREQEVLVEWWQCPQGRSFPINVTASVRMELPISPDTGRPEERHLIEYYRGRINLEDLFPDPEACHGPEIPCEESGNQTGVDTSRIQSYIVREFVEALKGISDDLKEASNSTKECMRLALLGSVSPLALAKRIAEAAHKDERSPTASGFQLVEILACLDAARYYKATARFRKDWVILVHEATIKVKIMLDMLQQQYPEELSRDFRHYAKTVRRCHSRQVGKR